MDRNTEISILAVAIDMRHIKQVHKLPVQEIILIDQRFQISKISMWEKFVDNECKIITNLLNKKPVIIGTHLKATSFDGITITTKPNSSILIDPQFQDVVDLKLWIEENKDILNDIISKKCYAEYIPQLVAPAPNEFVQLKTIHDMFFKQKWFWTQVRMKIKVLDQSFWFLSCENCNKISNSAYKEVYYCMYYKIEAMSTPRARAYVELEDSSSRINATLFGETAEKFLQCTAKTLMENTSMDQNQNFYTFIRTSIDEEVTVYLRSTRQEHRTDQYKHNVIFMIDAICNLTEVATSRQDHVGIEQQNTSNNLQQDTTQTISQKEKQVGEKVQKLLFPARRKYGSKMTQSRLKKIDGNPKENEVKESEFDDE